MTELPQRPASGAVAAQPSIASGCNRPHRGAWRGLERDVRTGLTNSMSPAVFIDLNLEALRHPRRVFLIARIAPRTRRARTTACAGVVAIPRPAGMILTHPAAILAERAFHR
jgi:hypothetical protein